MEHLRIENFLLIEHADFEVGRFTVFIGSQASGKSIVTKLLYFCREFLIESFFVITVRKKELNQLNEIAWNNFKQIFPEYTLEGQSFNIRYNLNNFEINLEKNNNDFYLTYSSYLQKTYEDIIARSQQHPLDREFLEDIVEIELKENNIETGTNTLFISASRSFFAMIQNNIFSLLARDIEVDYFVKQFGLHYESHKRHYNQTQLFISKPKKVISLVDTILMGRYQYKNEQDWLEQNGKLINIFHASSGQQEALPMLFMLFSEKIKNFFIEEPEAHLFPVSQKHIISILGWLYKQKKRDFFITTHSPYILTALNNAILAYDVIVEKGEDAVKAFFDPDYAINYDDVRAYTIENGRVLSVMDDETRLIGGNIIDAVSNEFETVFGQLLDLQG
jgi:AAA15 family ATPase/GTPase